jgi:thymidine kinase
MHGGMAVYRNTPTAARHYLEADRSRADDYYLVEGTGLAEHFSASPTLGVTHRGTLTGDVYEAWVAGLDPATGEAKGHLRRSEHAVRFVEVTVNGPKSWSLAAAIHADISAAYDAAQERAAEQIIGWLAQHATTRIGPCGAQVQVPVQEIEAVTMRHYTSRAGDPHRHLHLQINARVRAEDKWYGLHTVGVRDSLDAINGIGHAAMMTDPGFPETLAAHGFTLDLASGEIVQMREYVGAFSARAKQIERNVDRYEAARRKANPGQVPGPRLRREWDRRAWNDARPGKVVPKDGAEIRAHWIAELHTLGYHDPISPVLDVSIRPGELDRDRTVETVLARLGKRRSAWNTADVRGEVEQLIARAGVVTDAPARGELAEDLTARTLADCVPLLDRPGLPQHIRGLTSRRVLDVEADITTRLIDRAETTPTVAAATLDGVPAGSSVELLGKLDTAQREVVAVLAGQAQLVVVEGAAGAGKTTTLAAARAAIEAQGHRLVVVTPTRKAAQVAAKQLGTRAYSASWLAIQHGSRWDDDGTWTRLEFGQVDPASKRHYLGPKPEAQLSRGDVLLVDEAGMLDQDTAAALLAVADEHDVRIVLIGDRHQLAAVGRGGVLDLAARFADPAACVELTTVHRFADPEYAGLSLAMRTGDNPAGVFDALLEKGLIRVHGSEIERTNSLVDDTATALANARQVRVLADTNDQAAALNTAIRERLIATGRVDDHHLVTTCAGQRLGAGDTVMTRRNEPKLDVANRETWTITRVTRAGDVTVRGDQGERVLPAEYARRHVQLAYASTVYAAQGETVDASHLALGEHTAAASAYVGMTRGRYANTVHIVADSVDTARELWVETFNRDRADLGPAVAAQRAAGEAGRYALQRPLADALADLRAAWTAEADLRRQLNRAVAERERLRDLLTVLAEHETARDRLDDELEQARHAAEIACELADHFERLVATQSARYASELQRSWDQGRPAARAAAETVLAGPGRFGLHHRRMERAQAELRQWADTWRPVVSDLPTDPAQLITFAAGYDTSTVREQITGYTRAAVEHAQPDHRATAVAAQAGEQKARELQRTYWHKLNALDQRLIRYGHLALAHDPEAILARAEQHVIGLTERHEQAHQTIDTLMREPAIRSQTAERIQAERDIWRHDRGTQLQTARQVTRAHQAGSLAAASEPHPFHSHIPMPSYSPGLQPPQHGGFSI